MFPCLALVNNAAVNIHVQVLCGHRLAFLSGVYLALEMLGHVVTPRVTFWETAQLVFTAAAPFCIPTSGI